MTKRNSKTKIKPRSKLFPEPIGRKIPISEDLRDTLIYSFEKAHILDRRLFPFMEKESEYEWTYRMVGIFREAGISDDLTYAFVKTGRMLTEANIQHLDAKDIQEWNEAINEFNRSKNKNLINQALDNISRDVQCPNLSKKELNALFDLRNFHPVLVYKCKDTFVTNHMKESVLNGIMAILNEIKEMTGRIDLDGADLINNVFSPNKPILITGSDELGMTQNSVAYIHFSLDLLMLLGINSYIAIFIWKIRL